MGERIFNAEAQRRRGAECAEGFSRVERAERVEGERIFNAEAQRRSVRRGF